MILFDKRLKLAKCFEKWAQDNNVVNCPLSVIGWLYGEDMLNEKATLDFLKKHEEEEL